jgi:hypothetical protein
MFSALNPEELSIVLDAMEEVKVKAGAIIITEGEDGDNLYVVESGTLTCTKIFVRLLILFVNPNIIYRKDILTLLI